MSLTAQEAASKLDGDKYGHEGTPELFKEMKDAGLVAVFGASDDLMEFRGAIHDEVGCYDGGTAYLTSSGLLTNDCENDECPHFAKLKQRAATIEAVWGCNGYSWQYDTAIPNPARFTIMGDGEPYCEGIVFKLADVP
jgi:hypothetical protein